MLAKNRKEMLYSIQQKNPIPEIQLDDAIWNGLDSINKIN